MLYLRLLLLAVLVAFTTAAFGQQPAVFEPYTIFPLSQEAQTVAIGDLNSDTRDDIAVAAWPSALFVLYQQDDGTLGTPVQLAAPNMPLGLVIADLDADGRNDLAVGGDSGRIYIYYQQPGGTFGLPTICYAYGSVNSLTIADVNNDGFADIAATSSSYPAFFVLLQMASGAFDLPKFYQVNGANARCICASDCNSDGLPDLAMLLEDQICFQTQNPLGEFDLPQYLPSLWAHSMAAGDVTGDGLNDLVFTVSTNQPDSAVGVFNQTSAGFAVEPIMYSAYDFIGPLVLADIDGDDRIDIATAHAGYEAVSIFHQTSEGVLGTENIIPASYATSYQCGSVAAGDLNSDGFIDLAVADWWNGLTVFLHTRASDTTPPICTLEFSGTSGLNGWYVSHVLVNITASDDENGTGIKSVYYALNEGGWQDYAGPFNVSIEGITSIGYCAEDMAGNRSEEQWIEVRVDTEPPSLLLTPSLTSLWPPNGKVINVPIEVTAVDVTSGLAGLHLKVIDEYGLANQDIDVPSGWIEIPLEASRDSHDPDDRIYTLVLTGADAAGNTASAQAEIIVPKSKLKEPKKNK